MNGATPTPRGGLVEELPRLCVAIDLEVDRNSGVIQKLAGVRGDSGSVCAPTRGSLRERLAALDAFARDAAYVLGHNVIGFDLPHLRAVTPDLGMLDRPVIDTLRLNPLAFPKNPYHHLVKHYQDGRLESGRRNDPAWDARITLELLEHQIRAFRDAHPHQTDLLAAFHWLTTSAAPAEGFDAVFRTVRGEARPTEIAARDSIARLLEGQTCATAAKTLLTEWSVQGWPLAYALAWLSVAGTNSVLSPWVTHQFPEAGRLLRTLRDVGCHDAGCGWCVERHDAEKELARLFGLPAFRPEPADAEGRPLQRSIVEAAMRGEHVLGILPTGTGKSVCYQLPALSRFERRAR